MLKLIEKNLIIPVMKMTTLDYGISVPAGIVMPGGTLGKIDKCASRKHFVAKRQDFFCSQ